MSIKFRGFSRGVPVTQRVSKFGGSLLKCAAEGGGLKNSEFFQSVADSSSSISGIYISLFSLSFEFDHGFGEAFADAAEDF